MATIDANDVSDLFYGVTGQHTASIPYVLNAPFNSRDVWGSVPLEKVVFIDILGVSPRAKVTVKYGLSADASMSLDG